MTDTGDNSGISPAPAPSGYEAQLPPRGPSASSFPAPAASPSPYGPPPGPYGAPSPYGAAPSPYGAPAPEGPSFPPPAYGPNSYPFGATAPAPTNALAVVSLVAGILGFIFVLPVVGPLVAIITGHIATRQIRQSGEAGAGMALAGTVLGWVAVVLGALGIALVIILAAASSSSTPA